MLVSNSKSRLTLEPSGMQDGVTVTCSWYLPAHSYSPRNVGTKQSHEVEFFPHAAPPALLIASLQGRSQSGFGSRELFVHDPLPQSCSGKVRSSPRTNAQLMARIVCQGVKAGLSWCFDASTHGWDKENGKVVQTGRLMCWKPATERGEMCSASPQPQPCQPSSCILLARQLPHRPGTTAVPGKPRFTHGLELQLPPTDPARAPSLGQRCCHANAPWPVPGHFNDLHGHEDALSSSSCTSIPQTPQPGATHAGLGGQRKVLPDIFAMR